MKSKNTDDGNKAVLQLLEEEIQSDKEINTTLQSHLSDNIHQIRSIVVQFIILSSGIIGFTIPVLGQNTIVKTPIHLYVGLILSFIVVVYGLYKLTIVLENDNKKIIDSINEINKFQDDLRVIRRETIEQLSTLGPLLALENWIKKKTEISIPLIVKTPTIEAEDNTLLHIRILFITSLGFIILSVIPMDYIFAQITSIVYKK